MTGQESAAESTLAAEAGPVVPVCTPDSSGGDERLPHTCRCGARWAGSRTAHCASCHETFSGVTPFDAHRRGGECRTPGDVGLSLLPGRAYRCWGNPFAEIHNVGS